MSEQQYKECFGYIERAITHIARMVGCTNDEVMKTFKDVVEWKTT